jgi:hypothetical protein
MTDEILDLMEERRKHKQNNSKYNRLKILIRRKIREAKEKKATERCAEIEIFQNRYDSFNVHRKIKEVTGTFKRRHQKKTILL